MTELTLRDLEKLDIIEVTEEQIQKIQGWFECNYNEIYLNYNKFENVFKEFVLKIISVSDNEERFTHFQVNFMNIYTHDINYELLFLFGQEIESFDALKEIYFGNKKYNRKDIIRIHSKKINLDSIIEDGRTVKQFFDDQADTMLAIYFQILIYSQLNQQSIIRQTKTHTHKYQKKKDKRSGKKPKIKLIKQNIIRLNTDHIPELTEEEKKHYERQIAGWTVRGHWRTYQSGKKVWIKPQIRGDKHNIQGKVYEL